MTAAYKPGDRVITTGVYKIVHGSGHRLMHEATIPAGIQFPCCRTCRHNVRFILLKECAGPLFIPFRSTEILQEYSECHSQTESA